MLWSGSGSGHAENDIAAGVRQNDCFLNQRVLVVAYQF